MKRIQPYKRVILSHPVSNMHMEHWQWCLHLPRHINLGYYVTTEKDFICYKDNHHCLLLQFKKEKPSVPCAIRHTVSIFMTFFCKFKAYCQDFLIHPNTSCLSAEQYDNWARHSRITKTTVVWTQGVQVHH